MATNNKAKKAAARQQKDAAKQGKVAGTKAADIKAATPKKKKVSGLSKLRAWTPVLVIVVCAVAFVANVPLGNLSSFGWDTISAICPVGALSVLLSSKTLVPRVLISVALAVVLVLLFGRLFCSWLCTVPLVQRLLGVHDQSKAELRRAEAKKRRAAEKKAKAKGKKDAAETAGEPVAATAGNPEAAGEPGTAEAPGMAAAATVAASTEATPAVSMAVAEPAPSAISEQEREEIKAEMSKVMAGGCRNHLVDSRHIILGGALVSAFAFGFPVFCLICPIGLSFATVYLVLRFFTGQASLALVIVPLLLVVELLVFRRWCYKICPVSAFMSLVSKGNRTFVPRVDASKCVITSKGGKCGACNVVCPEGIDLLDHTQGDHGMNECLKCRKCVDACPSHAISMPFLAPKDAWPGQTSYFGPRPADKVPCGAEASIEPPQAAQAGLEAKGE